MLESGVCSSCIDLQYKQFKVFGSNEISLLAVLSWRVLNSKSSGSDKS